MNNEDYVSYEIAQALKKAGFDLTCDRYWYQKFADSDNMALGQASADDFNNDDWYVPHCSAPTLAQAQKWLREVKDCIIVIYPSTDFYDCNDVVIPFLDGKWFFEPWIKAERVNLKETASEDYPTYESALSAGIEAALKLIEEGEV